MDRRRSALRVRVTVLGAALTAALPACSSTYHPEYHPVTTYTVVHNVYTAPPAPRLPPVSSPGEIIIYGDFYGTVRVGE